MDFNITNTTQTSTSPLKRTESQSIPSSNTSSVFADNNLHRATDGRIGYIQQGQTGDCWLLASADAISRTDPGFLSRTTQKTPDGYAIIFPGGPEGKNRFEVTEQEFLDPKNSKLSTGDPDAKVLEIATREHLEANDPKKSKQPEPLKGNKPHTALHLFTGKDVQFVDRQNQYTFNGKGFQKQGETNIEQVLSDLANKPQLPPTVASSYCNDVKNLDGQTQNGRSADSRLKPCHSYAVTKIDPTFGFVDVANPHDTSRSFTLSRDTFARNFRALTYVKE